jgi:phage-related minor tail protein
MARQAEVDLNSVFMTENQVKNQQNLLKIQKDYETAAIAISKQFRDGNLTAKDYSQQIANLSDTYNDSLALTTEIFERQEALNSSYEYGATVALAQYVNQSRNLANASSGVVTAALRNTEDALLGVITGSQSASQAFSAMVTSILKDIARLMIQRSIVAPLAGFLSSAVGSFFTPAAGTTSTGLMTFDGVGYGGGRALGGRVNAGTAYLVGEQGAEKFIPNVDGTIVPNGAMGQTNNVVVNVNMESGSVNSNDAGKLGILIGNAVKQELVNQKRAGGLLA